MGCPKLGQRGLRSRRLCGRATPGFLHSSNLAVNPSVACSGRWAYSVAAGEETAEGWGLNSHLDPAAPNRSPSHCQVHARSTWSRAKSKVPAGGGHAVQQGFYLLDGNLTCLWRLGARHNAAGR